MNPNDVLPKLEKQGGLFEVYHVSTFRGFRKAKDGTVQEVEVQILDRGEAVDPHLRFICEAISSDGRRAIGNSADSVSVALSIVHWYDLDKEPEMSLQYSEGIPKHAERRVKVEKRE